MIQVWFCPKCSNRIVLTSLMKQVPFECANCGESWCGDDIEHFGIGLSEFDVAEVHDWLQERKGWEGRFVPITKREQRLLLGLEAVLDYFIDQWDARSDIVKDSVTFIVEDTMRRFLDMTILFLPRDNFDPMGQFEHDSDKPFHEGGRG